MCVSFGERRGQFSTAGGYKRHERRRLSEKARAMMAARETKLHFALPDEALPPIHSPEKIVVRGSVGRFDRMHLCCRNRCCERSRFGRFGRATDEQRDNAASSVE
jgi:hypothetical protein